MRKEVWESYSMSSTVGLDSRTPPRILPHAFASQLTYGTLVTTAAGCIDISGSGSITDALNVPAEQPSTGYCHLTDLIAPCPAIKVIQRSEVPAYRAPTLPVWEGAQEGRPCGLLRPGLWASGHRRDFE